MRIVFGWVGMYRSWLLLVIAMIALCGCQSTPKTELGRDGLTYTNTIHALKVWAAPGFDPAILKGKTLVITPTRSEVPAQTKPKEAEQFERLRRTTGDQIFYALDSKDVLGKVISPNSEGPRTGEEFILDTSVVEYYPGSAALRFTVGFSAGYPSITVYGILRDTAGAPALRFETQREFEARPFEYSDEQILENNIKDLAVDLADYLDRIISGKPLRK